MHNCCALQLLALSLYQLHSLQRGLAVDWVSTGLVPLFVDAVAVAHYRRIVLACVAQRYQFSSSPDDDLGR